MAMLYYTLQKLVVYYGREAVGAVATPLAETPLFPLNICGVKVAQSPLRRLIAMMTIVTTQVVENGINSYKMTIITRRFLMIMEM